MSLNARAWPASASRASSASVTSSECRNSPDRVRRVADVEVLRDAAEQVVAGDQQALLGLVQADVRRRVAGGLDDLPGAGVGLDRDAGDEVAVGVQRARLARPLAAPLLGPALQRLLRHAAEQRDLDRLGRGRAACAACSFQAGCIQISQPGAVGDRRRLPAVVDVGVGDHDQLDVAQLVADVVERALEVAHRVAVVHARCRRARSRGRPAAPTRCSAGRSGRSSGRRRRQMPGSTRSPRPPSRVLVGLRSRTRAARYRPGDGEEGPPPREDPRA